MRIEEITFSKTERMAAKNMYLTAIDIMEKISKFHEVEEIKNIYETDGPRQRANVIFLISKKLDNFTKTIMTVNIYGENTNMKNTPEGFIVIDVGGSIVTDIDVDEGPTAMIFAEFYMNHIYGSLKRIAARRLNDLYEEIEENVIHSNKIAV